MWRCREWNKCWNSFEVSTSKRFHVRGVVRQCYAWIYIMSSLILFPALSVVRKWLFAVLIVHSLTIISVVIQNLVICTMLLTLSMSTPWKQIGKYRHSSLILNLGSTWKRMDNFTPQPLHPQGKEPLVLNKYEVEWAQELVWFLEQEKFLPLLGNRQITSP